VIPAFNEEETIGEVIHETVSSVKDLDLPYEIIVVDDGSTDDTRLVAKACQVTVLSNGGNHGKGHSLRKGFQHSRGHVIVTIDADGSHLPSEIPKLVIPVLNGVDLATGSRFLGDGDGWTTDFNMFGNHLLNFVVRITTGKQVSDTLTGFRAFKRSLLKEIGLESQDFGIDAEITVKTLRNGSVFQEIPITCKARKNGVTKLKRFSDGIRILRAIIQAGLSERNS
jgi:glycosyltransferase involved in cell wall biosynthesis